MSLSSLESAGDGGPAGSPTCGPNECVAHGPHERLCPACAAFHAGRAETDAAAAPLIPAYLSALAALYRQLGGHWLREPERQAWREKMARELEQMGSIFEQPVHYTTVRPHVKDLEWGDGPASCVRVESAAVAPADVALAFLRCSRFELPGCPDRAATCAELAVLTMGLHQNPEAPFLMECSPFCGSVAGALAAWGTIAEELAAMAREWTVTWGPAASVYSREVLMLMGSGRSGLPDRAAMPEAPPAPRPPVPTSELEAAGAIIVKLRGEATTQWERAEAARLELARIKGAALPESLQPIERVHASVEEQRAAYGVQPRDGFDAHKDRGTLLDAVRALKAELGFRRSEHAHCNQIMLQRDRFEEQVGDMAAQAGCQDEFTSSHDHARCVDEAVALLRAQRDQAVAEVARLKNEQRHLGDEEFRPGLPPVALRKACAHWEVEAGEQVEFGRDDDFRLSSWPEDMPWGKVAAQTWWERQMLRPLGKSWAEVESTAKVDFLDELDECEGPRVGSS